jgi:hypothetical protein
VNVRLGFAPTPRKPAAWVRERLAWEAPSLPGLAPGTVRRWEGLSSWQPPETVVLCRHRALDRSQWIVTNRREPPNGYVLEYDLGLLQRHEQPGTRRLVERTGSFATDDGGDANARALGYVEQAAFPLMDVLELRSVRATGQHVLVAGAEDRLAEAADPVVALGFIEAFPIQPKQLAKEPSAGRHLALLGRRMDRAKWRHSYAAVDWGGTSGDCSTLVLGALWEFEMPGTLPLVRTAGGRLTSALLPEPGGSTAESLRSAPRWIVAPLTWDRRPHASAIRATGSRLRHVPRGAGHAAIGRAARGRGETLGHLRAEPAPGYSPLYSAHHPVLGDQFVTRSLIEATDLGYRVDGVLGHIADVGAERRRGPDEILWGARFGRTRRYAEG